MTLTTGTDVDAVAHNYHPLPVTIADARGAWVRDVEGRRYLDLLAGYSALNFGHRHPALVDAAHRQLERVTLTSRAFGNDQLDPFCAELAGLLGRETVLPMNTGAEAVETGIKLARAWGYEVRGVRPGRARIVVAAGSFHGRTTTIVGFSTDPEARDGFGPFTPGFDVVPFGDAEALRAAIGRDTVAVLLEPVQGEAGVIVPPAGYLPAVRAACDEAGILLVADEVQSGLGRTGELLATRAAGVEADVYLLGKALGGGIVPLSAVVADAAVLGVLRPGRHGSTFGGNPLACAVGRAVVGLLADGTMLEQARTLGPVLQQGVAAMLGRGAVGVRGTGLWAGIDVAPGSRPRVPGRQPEAGPPDIGRSVCEEMLRRGFLLKDTHGATIRLSPPLVITEEELRGALDALAEVLAARTGLQ